MDVEERLDEIRGRFGASSLERVEGMLDPRERRTRNPLQKGAKFILPKLVSKPWRDIDEFESVARIAARLESLHAPIRKEIHDALSSGRALAPYAHYDLGDFDISKWSSVYVFRDGARVDEACDACPTVARFMQDDLGEMLCPLQEMHFSIIHPGVHVAPHSDMGNFTLNLHFAIDVPDGCTIRVGHETRSWTEGKCLIFDDSFEHEVWNKGTGRRICLLMDIWNPELTPQEREAIFLLVTSLREAVDEG